MRGVHLNDWVVTQPEILPSGGVHTRSCTKVPQNNLEAENFNCFCTCSFTFPFASSRGSNFDSNFVRASRRDMEIGNGKWRM